MEHEQTNHLNVERLAAVLSEILSEKYDVDIKIKFVRKEAVA